MANATATRTAKSLEPLEGIDHRDGCPANRLETFDSPRPRTAANPLGGTARTTRCIDCGRDVHLNLQNFDQAKETTSNG